MKLEVKKTKRFKKSYKRVERLKGFDKEILKDVVSNLASGKKLGRKYKDHKLAGNLKDFRECHLAPDILLMYQIDKGILVLTLVNLGSHSELF